jgi:ATP-binding cassette subfamily A (ABC1) protein 3
MAEGQLRCLGSSLFLKRTYGVGYHLTVEKHSGTHSKPPAGVQTPDIKLDTQTKKKVTESKPLNTEVDEMLKDIVTNAVPDANLLTNVGTEISFQLPLGASSNFAFMLGELDAKVDQGIIATYGVGVTTLDEVFLLVARGETNEKKDFASSGRVVKKAATDEDDERSVRTRIHLENEGLFSRHVRALFKKRAANFKRDKKAWVCTTILPSLFVLIGFLLFEFAFPGRNMDALILELDDFNAAITSEPRNPIPFNKGSIFTCQPGYCIYGPPYGLPFVNESTTGEKYSFCGVQSSIASNYSCSIQDYENILDRITEAGAEPTGDIVVNVTDVRFLVCLF